MLASPGLILEAQQYVSARHPTLLSVCLSIYLCIYLSIYLPVYLLLRISSDRLFIVVCIEAANPDVISAARSCL
jgi:hypothetical protein